MDPETKTLYPCSGTKDRLGFGNEKNHVYLVYEGISDRYLTHDQAVEQYGLENIQVDSKAGTICPGCIDIALEDFQVKQKHSTDIKEIINSKPINS